MWLRSGARVALEATARTSAVAEPVASPIVLLLRAPTRPFPRCWAAANRRRRRGAESATTTPFARASFAEFFARGYAIVQSLIFRIAIADICIVLYYFYSFLLYIISEITRVGQE